MEIGILIIFLALISEYIDSSIGMGYGTLLTPILLLLGYTINQVVPILLLSELITGILAATLHAKAGNIQFFKENKILVTFKTAIVLGACGIIGSIVGIAMIVNFSKQIIKTYIGIMIFLIGIFIIFSKKNKKFSWMKIVGLGGVASFNKSISGGGYGPLVTGGQILAGMEPKKAVAITSLAEGITCFVGFVLYIIFVKNIDFKIAPFILIGAIASVPFSVFTLKKIKTEKLKIIIGIITLLLGAFTLIKILVGK